MKTDRQTIRTLLVDDHALFRESVARVLVLLTFWPPGPDEREKVMTARFSSHAR